MSPCQIRGAIFSIPLPFTPCATFSNCLSFLRKQESGRIPYETADSCFRRNDRESCTPRVIPAKAGVRRVPDETAAPFFRGMAGKVAHSMSDMKMNFNVNFACLLYLFSLYFVVRI
jgi:hypothetical protein